MGVNKITQRQIIGRFYNELESYTGSPWIDPTSMYFASDQASEEYAWLGMAPAMREWIGGRHAKGFRENGITIKNRKFEATLEVPVDWLRRDKTGQLDLRIGELADRTNEHWTELLSTLITNGTSNECYDGQYFFDDDHSEGDSGTQKNLLTASEVPALNVSTATTPTADEAAKAILGVITYMQQYKDDQGKPMNANAKNFIVMTAPTLWQYLAAGVYNSAISYGNTNPLQSIMQANGMNIQIVANPLLSYTKQFVTFRTDARTKPFIRQEEEGVTMSAIADGSEEEFKNDRHLYGVKALRNVGYGYWQYASHATLS